jgi:hypothetical protein
MKTPVAGTTTQPWHRTDCFSYFPIFYLGAYLGNDSRKLMPQNVWLWKPMLKNMDVGPADPAVMDFDQRLTSLGSGRGDLLDLDFTFFGQHGGFHVPLHSQKSPLPRFSGRGVGGDFRSRFSNQFCLTKFPDFASY